MPGLAWLAASAALAPPGFPDAAVGENLFGRFFLGTSHARPLLCVAAFRVLPAIDAQKSPREVAERAARLAPADAPIATARASLVGALRYYGERRIRPIASGRDFDALLAGGGRVLVIPASDLHLATGLVPVEIHARFRDGERALLVVTPLGSTRGESPILGYAPAGMTGAAH